MYIFTKFSWLKYNCQAVVEKEKKNQIMLRRRIDNIHSVFFTRITKYVENVWLSHADVYYLIFSIFSVICVLLTISWTLQKKKKRERDNLGIHPKDSRVSLALKFSLSNYQYKTSVCRLLDPSGSLSPPQIRLEPRELESEPKAKAEHQVSPVRWL